MMNETDIERIDAYLDDALSSEEVEQLDRRLAEEPDLAASLDSIRTQRAMRAAIWMSARADDASARKITRNVVTTLRQRQAAIRLRRWGRAAGALAACVMFGFLAGWIGRGRVTRGEFPRVAATSRGDMSADSTGVYPVALNTGQGSRFGSVHRAALGVIFSQMRNDDPLREQFPALGTRNALRIDEVVPGSPAQQAGLKAGDLVLSLGGESVSDIPSFAAAIAACSGETELDVWRDGKIVSVSVHLKQN